MDDHRKHLASVDSVLAIVLEKVSLTPLIPRSNYFESLTCQIINQQLSEKAADTITDRFIKLFETQKFPKPQEVLQVSDERLRSSGISYSKVSYIKNVARAFEEDASFFQSLEDVTDSEVIMHLTKIKGVGKWTAEMFLMFSLGREDIFSSGDQGLKNAIDHLYKFKKKKTPEQLEKFATRWAPYRTWASRYLWASLDV